MMLEKGHNKSFLSFSFVSPIICFVKLSVSYALLFFNCRNKLLSKEIVDRRGYSLKFREQRFCLSKNFVTIVFGIGFVIE